MTGAVLCPACGSDSWTHVELQHRRHEVSLRADPLTPLKDERRDYDELATEDLGWCCGVCRRPADAALVAQIEILLGQATQVG